MPSWGVADEEREDMKRRSFFPILGGLLASIPFWKPAKEYNCEVWVDRKLLEKMLQWARNHPEKCGDIFKTEQKTVDCNGMRINVV